jgi:hypothetical protein
MRKDRGSWSLFRAAAPALLGLLILPWTSVEAENIDPSDDGSQYAWAESVGWLSAEQDTDGDGTPDEGVTVTDFALNGWMWGESVGWVSLTCSNTSSCGTVDYGVTNDGCGNLGGYAWAENVGWIKFAHGEGGVTIDAATGEFSGEAWAENVGWISFASDGPHPYKMTTSWVWPPPSGTADLWLTHSDPATTLTWTLVAGATAYDLVEGDLGVLHATGDLSVATTGCAAENHGSTSTTHSVTPAPGDGYWFLVRGCNCGGNTSYDSGGGGQHGPRDPGVASSGNDCQ